MTHAYQAAVRLALGEARPGAGRIAIVYAAGPADGGALAARSLALAAASESSAPILLVDLDLVRNGQLAWAKGEVAAGRAATGRLQDGEIDGENFARLKPADGGRPVPAPLRLRRLGPHRLFVAQLDPDVRTTGATVQISSGGAYWAAARRHFLLTVVDAPPLSRMRAGLGAAVHGDAVFLAVSSAGTSAAAALEAKAAIEAKGADVAGVLYSGADPVLDRLSQMFARR
jgi:Mrp family chromosome partitioning ATPase